MKEKNEVAKQGKNEVGQVLNYEYMGATDSIDNSDIIIPKIMLMQQMSELVQNDQAKAGEYRDSIEGELLASKEANLDIIVIDGVKLFQVFKVNDAGKNEYLETIEYKGNEHLQINEELSDGTKIHRDIVQRFYCLILDQIKDGMAFPHTLDFKRTSRQAGKKLSTYFAKLRMLKKPSYAKVFSLGKLQKENDHGKFYVKDISAGRDITGEEKTIVEDWIRSLTLAKASGKVRVDESDLTGNNEENTFSADGSDLPF